MDIENVPTTPEDSETTDVVKKEKFYRNPKVIGGFVAGIIAIGVAVVIAGLRGTDPDTTPVEYDTVVETFKEETDTTL